MKLVYVHAMFRLTSSKACSVTLARLRATITALTRVRIAASSRPNELWIPVPIRDSPEELLSPIVRMNQNCRLNINYPWNFVL
jgi:hypothetical protein